jgi:hypothetical protein
MKTIITFLFVVTTALVANAQSQLQTILIGDTVELRVTGHNGTIQWQESTDSLTWTDMVGFTDSIEVFIAAASPTNKKYYLAIITDALCPNASPFYSSIIRHRIINTITAVQVGDWFRGGIIFNTDGSGNGLIAPQEDQSTDRQWGCYGTSIAGATSLTDGNLNTTEIINNCATRPIAASLCYDLVHNNYNDWFLPAKDQLNYLYQQQAFVGGFASGSYWTSTEYDYGVAFYQTFSNGYQNVANKSYGRYVRCVRSFSPSDLNSTTTSKATVTNQPVTVLITAMPQSQNKCLGGSVTFTVESNGDLPITYQWKKDGLDISGETNDTYTIGGITLTDEAVYTCEVTNLCRTLSTNNAELKVIQLTADAGNDTQICSSMSTILSATATSNHTAVSGSFTFQWSPSAGLSSANTYNPTASPGTTTDYTVQVTDQLGCASTDIVNVFVQNPFQNEQICLVTVDTAAMKNKILWEKTTNTGTAGYKIYKEVSTNAYSEIGIVPYNDPASFTDNSSQPLSYASRYKISVVDTCGNESDKSPYHSTINLIISSNGSTMGLNWSHYIDESGMFVPPLYYILRGTSTSNLQLLDSISGSNTSYNDTSVFIVYHYMIGVKKSNGCNTSKSATFSFSNIIDNSSLVGINSNDLLNNTIIISPNPMTTSATLSIPNFSNQLSVISDQITVTDITGKVVRTIPLAPSRHPELVSGSTKAQLTIERGDLKPGVYFIELKADRLYRGKLVVE